MSIFNRLRKNDKEAVESTDKKAEQSSDAVKAEKKQKTEKAKESKKEVSSTTQKAKAGAEAYVYGVLRQPIITEKATLNGTYVFEVDAKANKAEIKKAIFKLYGVTPKHVRIMNVKGKSVRWNYRQGQRSDWKKAIVRLPKGETINVYEGT